MKVFKRRELDPIEKRIKELKREQVDLQASVVFGQANPGDPEWEAASKRSKEIHKEIQRLQKGCTR